MTVQPALIGSLKWRKGSYITEKKAKVFDSLAALCAIKCRYIAFDTLILSFLSSSFIHRKLYVFELLV